MAIEGGFAEGGPLSVRLAAHQRQHRATAESHEERELTEIEHRWEGVEDADLGVDGARLDAGGARRLDDEGDVDELGVERVAVLEAAVVPELFAVVGGEDDDGVVPDPARDEVGAQAREGAVDGGDLGVVDGTHPGLEGFARRLVCGELPAAPQGERGCGARESQSCAREVLRERVVVEVGVEEVDEEEEGLARIARIEGGERVAEVVGKRLGRTILELGGNNAIVVTPTANMELAIPSILFGAVGTTGQRCTTTRRIIAHRTIQDELVARLVNAYAGIRIGDPMDDETLMGPLVNQLAVDELLEARRRLLEEGGEIIYGGKQLTGDSYPGGLYVTPCIAGAENHYEIVQKETFAPILYIIGYGSANAGPAQAIDEIQEAIKLHNDVPQGLSSAIFSENFREAEHFLSHRGSDCGIANVNIGTSGAEIGGAFGGEKETGGGRESGSDAWKAYMRRQTNTVNWSTELPLAQGLSFEVDQ